MCDFVGRGVAVICNWWAGSVVAGSWFCTQCGNADMSGEHRGRLPLPWCLAYSVVGGLVAGWCVRFLAFVRRGVWTRAFLGLVQLWAVGPRGFRPSRVERSE